MRRPVRGLTVGALAIALTAAGCSNKGGDEDGDGRAAAKTQNAGIAQNSDGPAPKVPGARRGGAVTIYTSGDFEHLDSVRSYTVTAQTTGTNLLYRSLTTYRENGDGRLDVVGDLATNTGEQSNGGRTWKYTLKDGLKYEDGSTITAKDVAYNIARSFSPELPEGPHWWAQWLSGEENYNAKYRGPYNGGALVPPNTQVTDDKTIIFTFPEPHADTPFAATLSTTSPVPLTRDTRTLYDNRPFSSGPYKIRSYDRSRKMVLTRNRHWDPKTDPARHAYPDSYTVVFTRSAEQASNSIIADQGADAAALTFQDRRLPVSLYPRAVAEARDRILAGPDQFVWQLTFNTQRVKDLEVRQALNYAIDREGLLKVWGSYAGDPATTLLSPTIAGHQKYNAYDGGKNGNITKAKELLSGKTVTLTYGYRDTELNQSVAAFLKSSFAQAGVNLDIQPIDVDQYYTVIGRKNNPFDMYLMGWGSDWPGAGTVIPALWDGRRIAPEGNINTAFLDDPRVNAEIERILGLSDLAEADKAWGALDKDVMARLAPTIPVIYDRQAMMYGSKIGGIYLSSAYGNAGLNNMYVK